MNIREEFEKKCLALDYKFDVGKAHEVMGDKWLFYQAAWRARGEHDSDRLELMGQPICSAAIRNDEEEDHD